MKRERDSTLGHNTVLVLVLGKDDVQTTKWSAMVGAVVGQTDSQKFRITESTVFRVAAKRKGDADFSILWFNDIVLGVEVDQIEGSLPLSFSLLAAWT